MTFTSAPSVSHPRRDDDAFPKFKPLASKKASPDLTAQPSKVYFQMNSRSHDRAILSDVLALRPKSAQKKNIQCIQKMGRDFPSGGFPRIHVGRTTDRLDINSSCHFESKGVGFRFEISVWLAIQALFVSMQLTSESILGNHKSL